MRYQIHIINRSAVPDKQIRAMLPALQKQLDHDFAPAWGIKAQLQLVKKGTVRSYQVIIKDTTDSPGNLGYHYTEKGLPITYVFAIDDLEEGGLDGLSTTLSHELLEMLADPNANLWADGFYHGRGNKKVRAPIGYEVCDPVQDMRYDIDGVKVSNFVKPEWFEVERPVGSMKFDQMGKIDGPFKLSAGGYVDAWSRGKILTVKGKDARNKKIRHRHHLRDMRRAREA